MSDPNSGVSGEWGDEGDNVLGEYDLYDTDDVLVNPIRQIADLGNQMIADYSAEGKRPKENDFES